MFMLEIIANSPRTIAEVMITPERRKQPQAMPKKAQTKVLFEATK
jgi:hypothetical protein